VEERIDCKELKKRKKKKKKKKKQNKQASKPRRRDYRSTGVTVRKINSRISASYRSTSEIKLPNYRYVPASRVARSIDRNISPAIHIAIHRQGDCSPYLSDIYFRSGWFRAMYRGENFIRRIFSLKPGERR